MAGEIYFSEKDGEVRTLTRCEHTHSPESTRAIVNRLARAIGHLESVKKMVEEVVEPGTIVECINLGPVIGSHIGPSFYSICGWGFHRREGE